MEGGRKKEDTLLLSPLLHLRESNMAGDTALILTLLTFAIKDLAQSSEQVQ